ncbi:MAG: hypothetical protein ABI191_07655 [Rhizomicrobium sp.]
MEDSQDDFVSLVGPLEERDGKLVLMIPLAVGGHELLDCTRGIAEVDGDMLCVKIPDWLATKFEMQIGSRVRINNRDGKFNISPDRGTSSE